MELRSSRVLKRDKPGVDSGIENLDSSVGNRSPLSSKKLISGANEVETEVCVDNADEDLETGWSNGNKNVNLEGLKTDINMDDKGLFSGSEVLDPVKDLVVSCQEGEIEEESVVRVRVECGNGGGGGEEGKKSVSINLSETDPGFKEETRSPRVISTDKLNTSPNVQVMDCENRSEHVESGKLADDMMIINGDKDKETSGAVVKSRRNKKKGFRGKKKRNVGNVKKNKCNGDSDTRIVEMKVGKDDVSLNGDGGECSLAPVKRKRGRKRKNVESFEHDGDERAKKVDNGGIQVRGRMLRSGTMTINGGVEAVDGGGTVVGSKRMARCEFNAGVGRPKKKLKRRGRPRKVQSETMPLKTEDETSESSLRPKKKLKGRGRPRKVQVEAATPADGLEKDGIMTEIPEKRLKHRGRPRKVQYEAMSSHEIPSPPTRPRGRPRKEHRKNMIFKKVKHRGRPVKTEARALATHVMKMRMVNLDNQLKENNEEEAPEIQKDRTEDGSLEVTGENPQTFQQSEENGEHVMAEGESHNAGKSMITGLLEKGKRKQLVRDKIVDMLLKAGWTIDRRPRQEKVYKDKVYIEPSGRSHWSITRAYKMLKQKIEDGDADSDEVSAYTPIPEEEVSLLFRHVDKVLGYKKKKNRIQKEVKKKPGKKPKDGSKRKRIWKSAARLTQKSNRRNGIITVSRKPRLLARSSDNGAKQENDGCLVYTRKRNILSWMIDLGVILPGWKVQYGKTRRHKRSFEGIISSDRIHCSCCNETMGISKFVHHAGGKLDRPFDNVFLESGTSLMKCLLDSWRKEEESNTIKFNHVLVKGDDPNDDTCNICGDGGDLICCDGCPSTFHQSCLDIQNFPSGDWNCIHCLCKFCRVVSVSAPQVDDSRDERTSEMLSCGLCEEKFHRLCVQEVEAVNEDSGRLPFCGRKCQELFERLQTYLGVRVELEDGFSWTLLQRSDVDEDFTVHETQLKVERNSKLAVAFSVMDECFVPIVDERSGTNIIRDVVYNCGSNFRRLNYAGFLTAVLEKDDELITAASIRIHGYQLAEMPFIGTRHMYRRQGMCRRLLDAIESTLFAIGVEELVIPAIPELLQTWTKVFGFIPLEESKKQAMKCMSMVVFPGIDMLQKPLLQNHPAASDGKAVEHASEPKDEQRPVDAAEVAKDAIDYEQMEEDTDLMDVCSRPKPNDKSVSQFKTETSNAIDCNQTPADASGVGKDAIDYEQKGGTTVVMDGSSFPEPNGLSVSQLETVTSNAIDCNLSPADAARVGKDDIDPEQTEDVTVSMDDKRVSQFETMSPNAIDYKQTPADACGIGRDVDHEQPEEATVLTVSRDADSLCDLNFPVKNGGCPVQVPCDTDVQTSDDSVAPPKSVPDCTIRPGPEASVTRGAYPSPKLESGIENDGIPETKASPLTSKLVPKNSFDLNLHPTTVDPDTHIIGDDTRMKSLKPSEARSQVDRVVPSRPDSKPCDTPPLVML